MKKLELMPLQDVHTMLLYSMKYINEISEKTGIPYFSHGGTTLGAVRHSGFIPWDDDIDLIMERKYYDAFVSACEELLPEELAVRTRENDPFFCEEYIKICYKDDAFKYGGPAVDVFILDKTNPDRRIFRWFQNAIIKSIRSIKLYKASRQLSYMAKYVPHNKLKHCWLALMSIISLKSLTNIQTKAMLAEKKATDWFVDWGSIVNYKKATWGKDLYQNRVKLPFENTYVYASDRYKDLLISGYGKTYMQLPPENMRKTHSVYMINNNRINMDKIRLAVWGKDEK